MTSCLPTCLREAEARVLRRLMKVRVDRPLFDNDPEQWLKTQFEMEIVRAALEYGVDDLSAYFEHDRETRGLFIHVSGGGEARVYGPVLWHVACAGTWDILSRRGVGYLLRHTNLL